MAAVRSILSGIDCRGHVRVRALRSIFFINEFPGTMLLIRSPWVPIIVALHHLVVLIVHQVVVLPIALHVLSAALALLLKIDSLAALAVLVLKVKPVVTVLHLSTILAHFCIHVWVILPASVL